ncbi:MAG: PDZ domain-containing protein [Myxococcota bacterium]|jgi:membrane-associated protease RseP (regulator of RpoE activity)|nr:PDZ domain-containing protein [Myxococcota bacterium]
MRVLSLLLLVVAGLGCAYPRRSTSLCPVTTEARPAPADVWRLAFHEVVIPPRQRGDQPWDEDGTPPDVFVRVYRGDALIFESSPVEGLQVSLEATTPNLHFPSNVPSRIELWDQDTVMPTVIGVWRGSGLPSGAMEDGDTRILLDGNASVGFRVLAPEASRGAGITSYEVRRKELRVVEVLEHSPAGRAGLVPGDAIVAIGGESIADLGEARAAGALSRACSEATRLTVKRADGRTEDLVLDRGFVWIAR